MISVAFSKLRLFVISLVADDEGVVRRERMAGIYRLSAYFLAVMTTEIPVVTVITTMFVTVTYWMAGLTPAAGNFLGHWLIVLMAAFACQVNLRMCTNKHH